ncbi:MAG: molybdenum cofactor biosynthesis protein MoaE [Chloroflexi bacterium]|nr:molybdenum cofactor biosynthesis protein MoaE [Chloroflexota bacterium]
MLIEVTAAPILPETAFNAVRRDAYGVVISYIGMVRNLSQEGRRVRWLELQAASADLARRELTGIAGEIRDRWRLEDVALIQRIGRLRVGEVLLVVAVGAPHRKEALEACQYAVDRFKEVSPAWITETLDH